MATTTSFTLGAPYGRAEIRSIAGDPKTSGGAWDTGYRAFRGEFFVFCGVGAAGRTGHDYDNAWDGERLVWQAKSSTKLDDPEIQRLISGRAPVHVFTRRNDRDPFIYQGLARAVSVTDTTPVGVTWAFDLAAPPPLTRQEVVVELERLGFTLDPPRVKSRRARLGELAVYIKGESESFVLVIDPKFATRLGALTAIPGVRRPMPTRHFVHNSSFKDFPRRIHTGNTPLQYGLDFDFDSREALDQFVATLRGQNPTTSPPPAVGANEEQTDPRTETESLRAARLGQTRFRNDLMNRWDRKCALTGLPLMELLRASHIKPWRDCSPKERRDPDNGLLLAVHVDGLFDRGLISFDDDGTLISSSKVDLVVLEHLGLTNSVGITNLSNGNRRYLALHRDRYFTMGTDGGLVG